jgi:serine/threonine protein kinase
VNTSLGALELIRKCLTISPSKRFTVDDIAAHRWINHGYEYPPVDADSASTILTSTLKKKKPLALESNSTDTTSNAKALINGNHLGSRAHRLVTRAVDGRRMNEVRSQSQQNSRRTSRERAHQTLPVTFSKPTARERSREKY